jgi:hypothetical protein
MEETTTKAKTNTGVSPLRCAAVEMTAFEVRQRRTNNRNTNID